jgi:D-glycerate 3-kinase
VLSLDDFYKTREEREEMARSVHPLFVVRGVPGTHDMALMNGVVDSLKAGVSVDSPIFNKAEDDRSEVSRRLEAVDVIVLEGWCWGSVPQPAIELEDPVNELEEKSDIDGHWRQAVNDALASFDYQHAFDNDLMIFLAVPNMEAVYRWRLQQEQDLQAGTRVMDKREIREFIMYYERITRAMLAEMPGRADMTLTLDEAHRIVPPG